VTAASVHFYRDLPEVLHFADVVDEGNYSPVPADWDIVMTDIRGSTRAIEAGLYRHVNALGASGIIALRNALPDVELPFVFGGDGATVLTPSEARSTVRATLRGLQNLARTAFDLELRCGVIAVEQLYAQGHQLKLARFRGSPHVTLAMLAGSALAQAETTIKQDDSSPISVPSGPVAECDLSGFECRWQPIKSSNGLTLALMVTALGNDATRQQTYRQVLSDLEQLTRNSSAVPVSRTSLRLMGPFGDYDIEARMQSGAQSGRRFDEARRFARKATTVGQALMLTKTTAFGFDGKSYPAEVLQNCDYRKFDNTLRMILDLSPEDYTQLRSTLEQYRHQGLIAFGTHTSTSALLTCYVRSFKGDHIHFVDAAEGGYAVAAKELKGQLKTNSRYPAAH
jgi:hypothetical protein